MDLDKGGFGFQGSRVWLGPSLGWTMEQVQPSTTITLSGTYVVQPGDSLILVNVAGIVTVQLPDVVGWIKQTANQPATAFDRSITIKDLGGNANSFNITIAPFGSQQIDKVAGSITITTNGGVVKLAPLIEQTGWAVASGGGGGGPSPGAQWPNTINVADFGAVGDGSADDTAALNAAFATLAGNRGLVLIPAGNYKVTNTITVGSNTGGGAPTSFISIMGTGGPDQTRIKYNGPNDRPALRFARNKFFSVSNINVSNITGAKGTSIGMQLGGSGGGGGNQCQSAIFSNCQAFDFNIGVTDGNFGAASEITWILLSLSGDNTGVVLNDPNSLNWTLINSSATFCGVGWDTGAGEGYHILGGGTGQNGIDFVVGAGTACMSVDGMRCEPPITSFMVSTGSNPGPHVSISNCELTTNNDFQTLISGKFIRLDIRDCLLGGVVNLKGVARLIMMNNRVVVDRNTGFPFIIDTQQATSDRARILCINNTDHNFPNLPCHDFTGYIHTVDGAGPVYFRRDQTVPLIFRVNDFDDPPNDTTVPFGGDYLALSCVRQLAEGPPVGNRTVTATYDVLTNAITAAGSPVLHFDAGSIPQIISTAFAVTNVTTGASVPANTRVVSKTTTSVTLNANVAAPGVGVGDTIRFHFTTATNATTAIGNPVLHFAAVPVEVVPSMKVSNDTAAASIQLGTQVLSVTPTTVTLDANVVAPGVGSGDLIRFATQIGVISPGQNLRVMGTFAGATTLTLNFKRTITTTQGGGLMTATVGNFFPTDVGKPFYVAGAGTGGWADMMGHIIEYVSSTTARFQPGADQVSGSWGATATVIGANEPDGNYVVPAVVGNANPAESYSVTGITSTGFTIRSSNATSNATVTALIVR